MWKSLSNGCEGRHADSKFRRAVRVKIPIEDRMKTNMVTEFKREKTFCEKRRIDEIKSFRPILSKRVVWVEPIKCEMHTSYEGRQGLCIKIATVRGKETGRDDTEHPTSRKLI